MKLNQDCIRQVLLDIEQNVELETVGYEQAISQKTFETFSREEIIYSIMKLKEANYINASIRNISGSGFPLILFGSITWEGHKFLDNVRDSQVWSKTKAVAKHLESVSITLISNIASQVITNLIEKEFKPN